MTWYRSEEFLLAISILLIKLCSFLLGLTLFVVIALIAIGYHSLIIENLDKLLPLIAIPALGLAAGLYRKRKILSKVRRCTTQA